MAARKTPNPKKPGTKGKAPAKQGVTARKAITRQYGLVKDASGAWVKPDMAFLERQLASQGWGKGQTGTTPVAIGGMRFLTGQGKLTYTGERSDSAKRNPGKAWSGNAGNGAGGGGVAAPLSPTGEPTLFSTGVSGASGAFIKEAGQSKFASGEAETATTKKKKKGKPKKKPGGKPKKAAKVKIPSRKTQGTPRKKPAAKPVYRASSRLRTRKGK